MGSLRCVGVVSGECDSGVALALEVGDPFPCSVPLWDSGAGEARDC